MEIFVSNGDVKATITTKSEKISLDNSELYKLIQNALGYSKTEKKEEFEYKYESYLEDKISYYEDLLEQWNKN